MVYRNPDENPSAVSVRRRIVVIYEDAEARDHMLLAGADLPAPARGEIAENVHWVSFSNLAEPRHAADAAAKAAEAELIVFAFSPAGDLPAGVKLWIEHWITRRSEREGAIVGVVAHAPSPGKLACLKEIYLRHSALRARMDYLSHVPSAHAKAMPDSLDSYRDRARQVTSLLDEILRSGSPPPLARL